MAGLDKDDTGIPSDLEKIDSATYGAHLPSAFHHELDGIHDGLDFPSEHERQTLRRVADTVPWNAYRKFTYIFPSRTHSDNVASVIAIIELAERFSFYGSSVVFVGHHNFFRGLGADCFLD